MQYLQFILKKDSCIFTKKERKKKKERESKIGDDDLNLKVREKEPRKFIM